MIIQYGGYTSDPKVAWFETSQNAIYAQTGIRIIRRTYYKLHFVLKSTGPTALNTAVQQVIDGFSQDGQDLRILQDDGTPTVHKLLNAETTNGVRVIGGPYFPGYFKNLWGQGPEMYNLRYIVIRLQADVLDPEGNIVFYHQALSQVGFGGRWFDFQRSFTGFPERQDTSLFSPFMAIQAGSAIGLYDNPEPIQPFWPASIYERIPPRVTKHSPDNIGQVKHTNFRTTWIYTYKASVGLQSALPPIYA